MAKYISNRQQNLKIGIVSYTENQTVLEVTGKVGIGTTNASAPLEVVGGAVFAGNSPTEIVRITQTGTGPAFIVEDSENPDVTPFVVTTEGQVAIGVGAGGISTGYKLEVDGGDIRFVTGGEGDLIISHQDLVSNIRAAGNIQLGLGANDGDAIRINLNNNVGLGTTNPTSKLYVVGDGYFTDGVYVSGNLGIGTTNPQSALDVRGAITVGVGTVGINSVFSTTDIQSWYYTGKSKSVTGDDTAPSAVYVGAAGTAMFMVGDTGNDINQYTLSTPYDVSTAGASIAAFSVATQETIPSGIDFNPTGTKMFISGQTGVAPLIASGEYVHEYSLSTAWTVSSAGYTTSFNVTAQDTAPTAVTFGDSGSKMYVVGSTGDAVYQYSLSTPYSLASGVTYDNISLILGTNPLVLETSPTDISFNSTGTVLWIVGNTQDRIYEFRLGTAWNISTAVFYDDVYIGFNEITVTGLHVIPEQNVAYIVGSNSDTVFQYSTNTPALEIASSGISSESSIILNNETRVKDKLYVRGNTHIDGNTLTQGTLTVDGTSTLTGAVTASAAVTFDTTTSNINLATSQTTGTLILGGTSQTGQITLGRATTSQTVGIATGVTASGNQKTINLGTGGASGSFTQINIGPTAGVGTVVINTGTNLLVGSVTLTGTASQRLQVTGGAYVSGNVGIGTTNPTVELQLSPNATISNVGFGITLPGTVGSALTVAQFVHSNANTSRFRIKATRNATGSDWTTASTKLVNVVDVTEQAYIEFNPLGSQSGGATGLAFGTGASEWARFLSSGNLGIGTTNPRAALDVIGNARVSGVVTATTFVGALTGTATTATKLETARTFQITGDVVASAISFDGTGNVSLAATIQPNSVALGSDTTGDYVQTVSGTSNQITVTGGTGESSTPVLSLPNNLVIPQDVTVTRDLQVNRNLNVTGNITIGGTSATIFSQSLNIFDPDIILGFRTDGSGNDVSNDNTANHGGVAVASTEGTPLVQLFIAGIETNPATYKKIMWFKAGTFAGLGTDAWLSNYAVGIGSTQFPTGTRLAAGSVQFTENDLAVVRNINASGIITSTGGFIGNLTGTATTATNLSDAANITTGTINSARLTGIYNIDISGNAATATYASNAGIATYASNAGIATYASNAGFSTFSGYSNVAGIATYADNAGIATYATNAGIATYATNAGIATYASNAGIATYATNAGIATYASNAGIATYADNAGISTFSGYSNVAGIATYASNAGIATYADNAGISTFSGYSNVAGIATYASNAGIATYASNAGIATYATNAGIATYADNAGISTFSGYSNVAGIATYADNAGISTFSGYSNVAGIATYASNAGIATYASNAGIATYATNAGIATYATNAGIATYADNAGISTFSGYSNVAGIATYATNAGIATYASNAGIATYATNAGIATYASNAGFSTFSGYSNVAGIATYADNAGISTNVIGGIASVTNLTVSGVSTFSSSVGIGTTNPTSALYVVGDSYITGILTANRIVSSVYGEFTGGGISGTNIVGTALSISGISTLGVTSTTNLTAQQLSVSGVSTFSNDVFVGSGITMYAATGIISATAFYGSGENLSDIIKAKLSGISVFEDGTPVGTPYQFSEINVIGDYVTATGIGSTATITLGVPPYADVAGIATYASNAGIATFATNSGIATYASNAGIATFATTAGIATFATTAGIATYASNAGIATYASNAGIATALQYLRTFEITGDIVASPISFDGTGNVSLAATIQPNSVGLGTDTFGDYVKDITGTSNQITVTGGTGEGSTPTLSFPNQVTIPQDLTVLRDVQIDRNLNVIGNITIGGTSGTLFTETLKISDSDIVLGFRTDAFGNDVSNDTTASHGGIAVASTEGNPLVNLNIVGIETLPPTYKKIMWFKSGEFAGLGTDAWLFNYAVGIGSTQFPSGTRLAAGSVQFTENDLAVVRNINASGVVTSSNFVGTLTGNASSATFATTAGIATFATTAGIATFATTAGIATYASNAGIATYADVAGIATFATTAGIATYADSAGIATYASNAGIATFATTAGIATYASNAGIATYADSAGIATYASNAGIATYATTAGIATYASNAGIATTANNVSSSININTSGIITATSFSGSGTNLTGIVTSIVAGTNITVSGSTGRVTINSTGGGGGGSIAILDDTSTNDTFYVGIASTTTGDLATLNVSSTKLTFNPSTGNLVAGGTVTANSDEKLKENIKTIENALEKVLSLRGVEYDRIDTGDHQIGVIAQEVERIIPDVVYGDETKSVAYGNIVGLLIEAIKDQNKRIEELERRLEGN
jgi:hypothetical protein